ncbi:MAG: specific processing protease-like protein [Bacilli bacterium]|nr:specific processing protease-like protein [Bacilli bacterium]
MIKHHLSNGLRVLVEQIPTCRSVSFGIWVKIGSRNESAVQNGISHFIEHMLFKGTDKYTAKDIAEIFDGIGGNVNAFTTKEYTCYYAKVLDEHLPIAVDVLADMFFYSQLDVQELDKERNVILEEISMYDDTPDDLVHDLLAKAAYGEHSLGYTILGTESNLNAIGSDDLRQFMDKNYNIQNTVIAIAGNVDNRIVELMESRFGSFANQGKSSIYASPEFISEAVYQFKQTEQNHICLSLPGCSVSDERLYGMILLNNTIGGGMSSRLFQEIREKRGLAYSVYSYHSSYMDSGLFTLYTGTAPKQTEEVLKVSLDVIADMIATGMTESELRKGKEQLKGSLILSLESTSSRMNRIGKNELMLGKHYTLDETIARIEAVEMEQINSLIKQLFAHPFALAMVGQSDAAIQEFRRDQLVI